MFSIAWYDECIRTLRPSCHQVDLVMYSNIMGNTICCRSIEKFIFGPPPSRILFLGLDAVGKTTMLYQLKLNQHVATVSTCGFNVEFVELTKNASFDIGSGGKIYPLCMEALHHRCRCSRNCLHRRCFGIHRDLMKQSA